MTCRNGHTFDREEAFFLVPCEGCSDLADFLRSIPGVRFPASLKDQGREWIERCEECELFESDEDAADALVRAGRIRGWRYGSPSGTSLRQPFAVDVEGVGAP
ncbi:MAG TPA: hypothetical protein VFU11_05075 [Solirubrobacterales bacterium]|nr:hypothetical protein [Solirubrobacterales bacterium]